MVFITIFFLAVLIGNSTKSMYDDKYNRIRTCNIVGIVVDEPKNEEYSQHYTVKVIKLNNKNNYKNTRVLVKQKLGKKGKNRIRYGDIVMIKYGEYTEASSSRNHKGFNYRNYLRAKKVYGIINAEGNNVSRIKEKQINWFDYSMHTINRSVRNKIYRILPSKAADICSAIILGNKDDVDDNTKDYFSQASLSHVLALSGMHMNYIVILVSNMFRICGKRRKKYIIIIFIIIYSAITGNSFSVLRAGIMVIYHLVASLLHRKPDVIKGICISSIIILVWNPYAIESSSFLLSFLATLSIVLFQNNIKKLILPNVKNKVLIFFKESISLSLSANILITPVLVLIYNKISFNFIISNVFISLLLPILIPLSFFCIAISYISVDIASIAGYILNMIYNLMLGFIEHLSNITFLTFSLKRPNITTIVSYYAICIIEVFKESVIKSKMARSIEKFIFAFLICISFFIWIFNLFSRDLKIYFVDVGQGDCTVICTPSNKTIIIDGGGSEKGDYIGKNTVVPYLLNRKILRIDYMIISHFDSDHVGGLLTVLEEMDVKTVIISKQLEKSENYKRFKEIVKNKKIKVIVVNKRDKLTIEKNLNVDILWPDDNNIILENTLNNNSIVCKLSYKNFSILFTGDIEEIAEKEILNEYGGNLEKLSSTVLKAAHHGSNTSSSQEFVEAVNPGIVLIGVGENNKFGHPNDEIIDRFNRLDINIFRTDKMGEITIGVDKNGKIKIKRHID